jgi:hypothetical protein
VLDHDDNAGIGSWPTSKGSVAAGAGTGAGAGAGASGAMLFGLAIGFFAGAAAFLAAGALLDGDFFGAAFFAFVAFVAFFGLRAFIAFFATFRLPGFLDGRAFLFATLVLAAARFAFAAGRFLPLRFFLAMVSFLLTVRRLLTVRVAPK